MIGVVVGLDIGGSKAGVVVATPAGERLITTEFVSTDWEAEPVDLAAGWIAAHLASIVPAEYDVLAVGVGAQGLDSESTAGLLQRHLTDHFPCAVAVNDAALLVPAAGFDDGIGVIAGTGSIGVGRDVAGTVMLTGGWGGVIGDDASAPAIVRDATKSALRGHDDGAPDDGLLTALLAAFRVDDAERLARAVNDDPTMTNWGPKAPAVFAAADAGSPLAIEVIDHAAAHLVLLVSQLLRRGAVGDVVVAAGSVIVHQPRLAESFIAQLARRHPSLAVLLLTEPPALGAVALALRALVPSPDARRAPGHC